LPFDGQLDTQLILVAPLHIHEQVAIYSCIGRRWSSVNRELSTVGNFSKGKAQKNKNNACNFEKIG
jgi:hypothetical protein